MASSTTKAGPLTAASTNMLQPTNAAQASGLASLITATATPTFTALGSPHASSPLSGGSPSALLLQADIKVSSEIDTLVALGKTGGTIHASMDEIRVTIAQKIQTFRKSAKDPYKLTSVRYDLCKLSRISSTYYSDLKEEVFDLLTHLIEEDPIMQQTANGILDVVIELNADLALSKAQKLTILFQKKLARAFSAAVELYLRHYNEEDHVNAVMEDQKKELLETQSSFSGLNTKENMAIEFANQMAMEASKRLTSDNSVFMEVLQRLTHFAIALQQAYNTDLASFISEIGQAFQGLDNKFKEKWFEALFMLRDLVHKTPDNLKKVTVIQTMLVTKKASYDWKFTYGALEILGEVVACTEDVKVLEAVLFGQSLQSTDTAVSQPLKMPTATATLSAAVAQLVAPKLSGVVDFLEFKGYVEKAFIAVEGDRKADSAIQAKSKELCTLVIQKLSATYEGRKLILDSYLIAVTRRNANDKIALQILGNIVPADPKKHLSWLGTSQPSQKKERVISKSLAIIPPIPLPKPPQTLHKPPLPPLPALPLRKSPSTAISAKQKIQEEHEKDIKHTASATSVEAAAKEEPMSEFHQAVGKGDLEAVKKFISQSKELVHFKDSDDNTPLIAAAKKGHFEVCAILLKTGADPLATGEFGDTAMHKAAYHGHVEIIRLLSAHKQLINLTNTRGITPLMWAAQEGHSDICEDLLKAGANPLVTSADSENVMHFAGTAAIVRLLLAHKQLLESKNKEGMTPFLKAVSLGNVEVCEILLTSGADSLAMDNNGMNAMHYVAAYCGEDEMDIVRFLAKQKQLLDSKTKDGTTPLIRAAHRGNQEICEVFLKAGANPLITDNNGVNAMHIAAGAGFTEIVTMLLPHKQLIDSKTKEGHTPLLFAVDQGHLKACELLVQAGANLLTTYFENDWTAMHLAISKGKNDIVHLLSVNKQLIEAKNKDGETPLWFAARYKNLEACELLLKAGADPLTLNEDGVNVMHWAVKMEEIEIVRLLSVHKQLLDSKTKADADTPLMFAAQRGCLDICEILLKAGANPHVTNKGGWSAMHFAAIGGKTNSVQLLSAYKQLIDSRTIQTDVTPLMLAASDGYLKTCEALLKAGADPLAVDMNGDNAMHWAVKKQKTAVVKLFSENKQLLDAKNKYCETPLMRAAKEGHSAVCEALLKTGANPHLTNAEGQNAMQLAEGTGNNEIVQLLSEHMKQIDAKK